MIENINRTWENIKENNKTSSTQSPGLNELKYKLRFDEECLGVLDQRNQDKSQWLQNPSQNNIDNLNNV